MTRRKRRKQQAATPLGGSRRGRFWAAAICLVALGVGGAVLWRLAFSRERPNILLISLCSVWPDHMSLFGYARRTTPSFDALVEQSIVYEHTVSQWPKTAPAFAAKPRIAQQLRRALETWSRPWVESAYQPPGQIDTGLDDAILKQLRALGYVQ